MAGALHFSSMPRLSVCVATFVTSVLGGDNEIPTIPSDLFHYFLQARFFSVGTLCRCRRRALSCKDFALQRMNVQLLLCCLLIDFVLGSLVQSTYLCSVPSFPLTLPPRLLVIIPPTFSSPR